mgnify:CR=1 FL=1
MNRIRVLFIGNFLSRQKGTKGISEKLFVSETIKEKFDISTASDKLNKVIRLSHMAIKALTFRGELVHIDVYSGPAFFYTWLVSRMVSLRGKKIIMTLHGGALPNYYEREFVKCKTTFLLAHKIVTPSKFLQRYFQKKGYNVHYIPNSIDFTNFTFNRENFEPHTLLWVRAFTDIYNPLVPIRILFHLKDEFPDSVLTMVGPDKGKLSEVKNVIRTLGLEDSINITGPIPNEELQSYYQSHHVYLNTTSFESFGVAVLEAASCGIPVVSNSVGEIPLIWKDRVSILLVKENDIFEYCKQIKMLFNDDDLSMNISQAAKATAGKFGSTEIEQEWVRMLYDVFEN